MTRRRFILAAAGIVAIRGDCAQRGDRPAHVAILWDAVEGTIDAQRHAFFERLSELGHVEGKSLRTSARYSQGLASALPALAAEMVALGPDVLVTITTSATLAAMRATSSVPIVFIGAGAPVETGLVRTLSRPGGNVTGNTVMSNGLATKWLEILTEIAPGARRIAFLGQSSNASIVAVSRMLQEAAAPRKLTVRLIESTTATEVDRAFDVMTKEKFDAFIVAAAPVILAHRERIVELASRHRLPAIYSREEYVAAGGLVGHYPTRRALYRRGADYVHRILLGAKPADLPVEQPTEFELVVNLKAAQAAGIAIPTTIRQRADRTIP